MRLPTSACCCGDFSVVAVKRFPCSQAGRCCSTSVRTRLGAIRCRLATQLNRDLARRVDYGTEYGYFVRVQNKIPRQHAHKGAWGAGRITSHRWVDAGDAMGAVAQQFPVNCCHCVPVRGCTRHHSHIQRSILGPHPTLRHPALLCCCNELPHSTPAAHRMPWIRHLHSLTADEQRATPLPKLFDGDKCPILGELVPSTHRLRLSTSLHPGYDASRTCQPQVQPLHARANQWPSDWEALSLQTRRRVSPGPAAWVPYDEVRTCLGWAPCSRPAQLVRPRSRWKAVYNTLPAGP